MKKLNVRAYAFWMLLTLGTGVLSAWLTGAGRAAYSANAVRPPLSPPDEVFPIVWTLLYALMGISAARVALTPPSGERTCALRVFAVQLAFNFLWSILFFNVGAYGLAWIWLAVLWVLIAWMLLSFRRVDRLAAALQLPYLIWVGFAGLLNIAVWRLY